MHRYLFLDILEANEELAYKTERLKSRFEFNPHGVFENITEFPAELNSHQTSELSNRISISPHSPILPPIASPKLDKQNASSTAGRRVCNFFF